MATRRDFIRIARSHLGAKWQHQGRTAQGVDCGGLIAVCARQVGIQFEDCTTYGRMPDGKSLSEILSRYLQRINLKDLKPGDVVLMGADIKAPCHVALVTDIPKQGLGIIHASAQMDHRRVVEQRLDDKLRSMIRECFRVTQLED